MAKLAGTVTVELSTPNREILYGMHKMLCNILVEQRKIVQGNAANFDQLRAIRLLLEKKAILSDVDEDDSGYDCHLPPSSLPLPQSRWCEKCKTWIVTSYIFCPECSNLLRADGDK